MKLYCGIDLHSNNSLISVINERDEVIYEKRLPNDMNTLLNALRPYQDSLHGVVVESTFNWYWLVDGLLAAGLDVRLANTFALKQYQGLKYTDDKTDARHLAHMLRLGILPDGYIYPFEMRCVRDALRRRLLLVRQRVTQHLSLQSLIARHTGKRLTGPQVKKLDGDALDALLTHPAARLTAGIAHDMMKTLGEAIERIERNVAAYCQPTPGYEIITGITGIGPILAKVFCWKQDPLTAFQRPGTMPLMPAVSPAKRSVMAKRKVKAIVKMATDI